MPATEPSAVVQGEAAGPCVVWIGAESGPELGAVRRSLGDRAVVLAFDSVAAAVEAPETARQRGSPTLVILATDRPGRWSLDDAIAAARRWPIAPLVSVATSLADGRRRSGPPLPGIDEVPWHDLLGRLERWLVATAAGRPGALGLPATARREERVLEATESSRAVADSGVDMPVAVAAHRADDLEGIADLLTLAGRRVVRRTRGRPPLDESAPLLVWDVVSLSGEDLAWLQMLSANRPALGIVVLESFPRGDSSLAALRAGAWAVLGRPVMVEALTGTLLRLENRVASGLGAPAQHR